MTQLVPVPSGVLPTPQEFELLQRMLRPFLESGFLPNSIKSPAQALTIAIKGRDLGIPPLQAFSQINVIQGKPTISPELMLALIFRRYPTASITYLQNDAKGCIIEASRPSGKASTFSFTMDDAVMAGLASTPTWKKYPSDMLKARAISRMARSLFPDCLMGCSYTPEELGASIEIDAENNTIVIENTGDNTNENVQKDSSQFGDSPTPDVAARPDDVLPLSEPGNFIPTVGKLGVDANKKPLNKKLSEFNRETLENYANWLNVQEIKTRAMADIKVNINEYLCQLLELENERYQ